MNVELMLNKKYKIWLLNLFRFYNVLSIKLQIIHSTKFITNGLTQKTPLIMSICFSVTIISLQIIIINHNIFFF
jgi:hypothetical protein